ncbi:hypothetical protein Ddye_026279 [Dipteronia dyeriana]|uniref:Uncharacterized protein n=1 Tax=Dipteronia dyeriana TaxID=168575 RepID=A0AAD9TLV7_9ROSI|nr:hypothetical protein Ddye_026279 [Dipteronia dyeriana]
MSLKDRAMHCFMCLDRSAIYRTLDEQVSHMKSHYIHVFFNDLDSDTESKLEFDDGCEFEEDNEDDEYELVQLFLNISTFNSNLGNDSLWKGQKKADAILWLEDEPDADKPYKGAFESAFGDLSTPIVGVSSTPAFGALFTPIFNGLLPSFSTPAFSATNTPTVGASPVFGASSSNSSFSFPTLNQSNSGEPLLASHFNVLEMTLFGRWLKRLGPFLWLEDERIRLSHMMVLLDLLLGIRVHPLLGLLVHWLLGHYLHLLNLFLVDHYLASGFRTLAFRALSVPISSGPLPDFSTLALGATNTLVIGNSLIFRASSRNSSFSFLSLNKSNYGGPLLSSLFDGTIFNAQDEPDVIKPYEGDFGFAFGDSSTSTVRAFHTLDFGALSAPISSGLLPVNSSPAFDATSTPAFGASPALGHHLGTSRLVFKHLTNQIMVDHFFLVYLMLDNQVPTDNYFLLLDRLTKVLGRTLYDRRLKKIGPFLWLGDEPDAIKPYEGKVILDMLLRI